MHYQAVQTAAEMVEERLKYLLWVLLFSDHIHPWVQFEGGNNSRAGTIYFAHASANTIYSMHTIIGLAHEICSYMYM